VETYATTDLTLAAFLMCRGAMVLGVTGPVYKRTIELGPVVGDDIFRYMTGEAMVNVRMMDRARQNVMQRVRSLA